MKPFLHGKKTVALTSLRPAPGMNAATVVPAPRSADTPVPVPHKVHVPAASPTVEAIKEGDKVVRLVVTCSCGERIEVQCLYPAGK